MDGRFSRLSTGLLNFWAHAVSIKLSVYCASYDFKVEVDLLVKLG